MMADSQKEVKKEIKKEVKKEVQKENKKKQYQKKKSKNKSWKKEKAEIRKDVKKEVKKENQGPKPKFRVNVTATLGYIDGSKEHGPETKIAVYLHPSLCKGPDEETAFGPLQAAAAQHGMWRVSKLKLTLTPLVGSSAVSGTIVRASLNMTSGPGSTSWGGLGARKHRDFQAGRAGAFILTRRDTAGPRSGGWWITDTNVEGNQSSGPVLEMHTLGQTMSTYKDAGFEGQLFIVEVTGTWEFTNYTMHPGMGTLERKETSTQAAITVGENNEIQMEIPEQSEAAMFMSKHEAFREGDSKIGEVIYQVVDSGANMASSLLPPPFGWLIKGGWWFVKQVLGRTNNGNKIFKVYPSYAEAQNDKPAISTGATRAATMVQTELQLTQMNTNNLGGRSYQIEINERGPIFPIQQQGRPGDEFQSIVLMKPIYRHNEERSMVLMYGVGIRLTTGTTREYFPAVHYQVSKNSIKDRIMFLNTNGNCELEKWANPNDSGTDIQCRINATAFDRDNELVGKVVAYRAQQIGTADSNKKVYICTVLWKSLNTEELHWVTVENDTTYMLQKTKTDIQMLTKTRADIISNNLDTAGYFYVTIFLAKKQNIGGYEDMKTAEPVTAAFQSAVTFETSIGLLLTPSRDFGQFWTHFVLKVPTRRETKIEKLMKALGIQESDEETDSDEDTNTESDDGFDTVDELETVTSTPKQQRYENLMKLGLTHEQAEKVLKSVSE
uniref:Capsid protein n=1 Tax=Coleura bat astrovirus TaxID=3141863 RepID=A0AAU7E1U2_9VIRU